MPRTFDYSNLDVPVPVQVLNELERQARQIGLEWILIGAAARDLVIHLPLGHTPRRATHDVDIAIAIENHQGFLEFTARFKAAGGGEHRVVIGGVDVDVVPFGPIETDGKVMFNGTHELDVVGFAEAALSPDRVTIAPGLTIDVASLESQSVLKLLAWRDRRQDDRKDAADLLEILKASSEGLYEDEAWADDEALDATGSAIQLAGPWRTGRAAGGSFLGERAEAVRAVIDTQAQRARLVRDMGSQSGVDELVESFWSGLDVGLQAG